MSTITLDDFQREPGKWAQLAADSGETVLVTKAGQPLVKITAAVAPKRKTSPLPDRERRNSRA
jgi:antitoxin (DNA-binding transcriptional repressor) of toxin-antitoxin stability system